ncbi:MAG: hypothetical protein MPJ50_09060 [Pirellulales bacterium]|nr:hypothetical protein [Pirellulales bacterium]
MAEETTKETGGKSSESTDKESLNQIILRPYPKVVFLWPTFMVTLGVALWLSFTVDEQGLSNSNPAHYMPSLIFLVVFSINLVVIAFDFPRTTSLTLFFLLTAVVCGGVLLFTYKPEWASAMSGFFELLRPTADALFYWLITIMLGIIYVIVMIAVRFDYWEVRPNELLHHHGILSNLERFSAPNLRIEKEINDVFEYLLLRSGRLILSPRDVQRPIVLDNVLFISKKEQAITKMLSALQVQVRND